MAKCESDPKTWSTMFLPSNGMPEDHKPMAMLPKHAPLPVKGSTMLGHGGGTCLALGGGACHLA